MCLAPCALGMGGEVGRRFLVCNRLIDYVLNVGLNLRPAECLMSCWPDSVLLLLLLVGFTDLRPC